MKKFLIAIAFIFIASICSAAPARIGVLAPIGMTEEDVLRWSENVAQAEGKTGPFKNENKIFLFQNLNEMIMSLEAGKIDRFAIGEATGRYIAARNKNFNFIDHNHNAILGYAMAMREEDKPKLLAINLAINDLKANGTLRDLIKKYILNLGDKDPEPVTLPFFEGERELNVNVAITGDLPPMDCILPDGTPAGFNTAFLAELSKKTKINFNLVSVSAGARQTALSSGKVDLLFWTRVVYNEKGENLNYPLDVLTGVAVSDPYLLESRAAVELKK